MIFFFFLSYLDWGGTPTLDSQMGLKSPTFHKFSELLKHLEWVSQLELDKGNPFLPYEPSLFPLSCSRIAYMVSWIYDLVSPGSALLMLFLMPEKLLILFFSFLQILFIFQDSSQMFLLQVVFPLPG